MTSFRSRKDGSHYPLQKSRRTGTLAHGTTHLSVPKRITKNKSFVMKPYVVSYIEVIPEERDIYVNGRRDGVEITEEEVQRETTIYATSKQKAINQFWRDERESQVLDAAMGAGEGPPSSYVKDIVYINGKKPELPAWVKRYNKLTKDYDKAYKNQEFNKAQEILNKRNSLSEKHQDYYFDPDFSG